MTPEDLVSRVGELLTAARVVAEDVEDATADIFRQGVKILYATSFPQAHQCEASLNTAYEKACRADEKLAALGREVDRAERALGRWSGGGGGDPGAVGECGTEAEVRMLVGAFRDIADVAREREAKYEPVVEDSASRLRDFAAFGTVSLHVWLDLEGADRAAADEGLVVLRRLEYDLATLGVTEAVSELERRRAMLG